MAAAEPGDPRLAFVFDEARRAVTQQIDHFDGVRSRAALLFSAGSVAASVLSGIALRGSERPSAWTWAGVGCYLALATLVLVIAWPRWLTVENDAAVLLSAYVDQGDSIDDMRRTVAAHMANHYRANLRVLRRLTVVYELVVLALGAQIVALMLDLHGRA